jgi:hypothetical protein
VRFRCGIWTNGTWHSTASKIPAAILNGTTSQVMRLSAHIFVPPQPMKYSRGADSVVVASFLSRRPELSAELCVSPLPTNFQATLLMSEIFHVKLAMISGVFFKMIYILLSCFFSLIIVHSSVHDELQNSPCCLGAGFPFRGQCLDSSWPIMCSLHSLRVRGVLPGSQYSIRSDL